MIVVDPGKGALDFPALPTVTTMATVLRWTALGLGHAILAIRDNRDDLPPTQLSSERVAIIAFVQPKSFRAAATLANPNAINRLQDVDLIIPMRATQREVQRMTVCIRYDMAFDA